MRVLNQFEVMGNYRFHYEVTGGSVAALAPRLREKGIGDGRIAAFVSSMGSAGTIAAGDRLKQIWPEHKIVGLEPIQCRTLYDNGYGSHEIQGIGDKHVTWIHHVANMDALICIDDMSSVRGLSALHRRNGTTRDGAPLRRIARGRLDAGIDLRHQRRLQSSRRDQDREVLRSSEGTTSWSPCSPTTSGAIEA